MQPNLNFWPIQNETGSVERFLSRLDASVIFADPEFSRLAGSFAPAAAHEWIALAPGQDESVFANASPSWKGRNIFLFCVAGYAARAARLKDAAAKVGARFVDWPYEVFPSFVGFNDSWRQTDDELAPLRRQFLIISTARSGSTYLAELLQKNGFGNPKEHIRKPYFELIRHRKAFGIDLARFGRRLERACASNGMFGSKVISGFLWPVLAELNQSEQDALFGGWLKAPVVYLVRESKVDQAISDFMANATTTWHVRNNEDLSAYKKTVDAVTFDFDKINKRFSTYVKDETELRNFLRPAPQVKTIRYADLIAEPEGHTRDILMFIDPQAAPATITTQTSLIKTGLDRHQEFIQTFVAEIRKRGLYKDMLNDPLFAELR